MLPPTHSVTLKPSSLSSPVNSRLTPPRREPHSVWILMHEVSSLMIVPKWRVLSPALDVCVLEYIALVSCVADARLDGMGYGRGRGRGKGSETKAGKNFPGRAVSDPKKGKEDRLEEEWQSHRLTFHAWDHISKPRGGLIFVRFRYDQKGVYRSGLGQMEDVNWPLES